MTKPRLYLHVGLQKTGTSYLQGILWASVPQLRDQSLDLVPDTRLRTFWVALDVRDRFDPRTDPPAAAEALTRFGRELAASTASRVLLSHEWLAAAETAQITRLLAQCSTHEVHVIVTARDLGRHIPSAWQESLKAGRAFSLDDYLESLKGSRTHRRWRNLDLADTLARWSRHVGPTNVHVVTVPPPGGDPRLLLHRICEVLDLDPATLDTSSPGPGNRGLNEPQAEVLRLVNAKLPQELRRRNPYGDVGKRFFAAQILQAQQQGPKIRLSSVHRDFCVSVSEEFVASIEAAGYHVVGDLADLVPRPEVFASQDASGTEAVLEAATQALADVLRLRLTDRLEGVRARAAPTTPRRARTALHGRLRSAGHSLRSLRDRHR